MLLFPARPRTTPLATLTVTAAVAAAVALAGALVAPASAAPRKAAKATAVPTTVANTNEALALARVYAREATSPRAARTTLRLDESPWREASDDLYQVSTVRNRSFTFTFGLDQACLAWPAAGQAGIARPGACRSADRLDLRTPLLTTAKRFGRFAEESASDPETGPAGLLLETTLRGEGVLAWMTPAGVRITGVTDVDRDTVEDDGRITYRAGRRAVCLQLPLRAGERSQVFRGGCASRPARDMRAVWAQLAG